MKIIINIPDEVYNTLLKKQRIYGLLDLEYFIIHGTPLPKGHGRIIDESEILSISYSAEKHWIDEKTGYHYFSPSIIRGTDAPTIIEADKAESEEV